MQSVEHQFIDVGSEQTVAILARRVAALDFGDIGTLERLAAMTCIASHSGPVSVTVLANEQEVRPATMSRMLTSLFDDGMIKRVDDATDGRGRLVAATAKGLRATRRARKIYQQNIASIVGTQLSQ